MATPRSLIHFIHIFPLPTMKVKGKLTIVFILIAIVALGSATWQAYEAWRVYRATTAMNEKLQLEREARTRELVEESLPRLEIELSSMLQSECAKLHGQVPFNALNLPTPEAGRAPFNKGFFLYSHDGLVTEEGAEAFHNELMSSRVLLNTARRKADNPSAPVLSTTTRTKRFDRKVNAPTTGVFFVEDPDSDEPTAQTGTPGPFFVWNYGNDIVCMRSVPTNHGNAAQGFVMDQKALMAQLMPLVAPELKGAVICVPGKNETPNLKTLPLILRPGAADGDGDDTFAEIGTVAATWITSGLSILVLLGLLVFYARVERRRSDFVSAVTHELRTPLTTFSLYTEMLRKGGLPPEKVEEYHATLYNESRRLGHLVENVLAFARLSRGKVRGRMDKGPCADLLPRLLEPVCERLRKAGFTAGFSIDQRVNLVSLRTDLSSLEQIFVNLTDNAIKYVDAPDRKVTISVMQGHRALSIRFADNGPGVAPEAKAGLFHAFSRSAQADASRKPGVGLGLALSRDLARSIGGDLSLEKSDAKGCTFLLTLPLGE